MASGDMENPMNPEQTQSARQASVTLRRQGQSEDNATQLDPANQSLAEALGLVFRLLQMGMVVLFAVFMFSGFQSIRENEAGIRLLFGKPAADALPPGFQFSFPYPLGEMVKIDTGAVDVSLDRPFWPAVTEQQRSLPLQQLAQQAAKFALRPGEDGSLITGDENLVHTQWRAMYQRRDPVRFVERISPEAEKDIVRAAIQRGVVQAIAEVGIDDFLQQSSEQGSVAIRARERAQAMLDRIDSGIQIEMLLLEEKAPPFAVYNDFAGVQAAEQRASKARTDAETQARDILHAIAGGAYAFLIDKIDQYEQAVALADTEEQVRLMQIIRDLMDGREVRVGEEMVRNQTSGAVASMLSDARRYRTTIVSQRERELKEFEATLAQFRANPDVVLQTRLADAMMEFLDHDYVEIYSLASGIETAEMWINRDMEWQRQADRLRKERENRDAEERRRLEQERERFRTRTDVISVSE